MFFGKEVFDNIMAALRRPHLAVLVVELTGDAAKIGVIATAVIFKDGLRLNRPFRGDEPSTHRAIEAWLVIVCAVFAFEDVFAFTIQALIEHGL